MTQIEIIKNIDPVWVHIYCWNWQELKKFGIKIDQLCYKYLENMSIYGD